MEDNTLHIKPVDTKESVEIMQEISKSRNSDIVIDDTAEYSYSELKEAQNKISINREKLDIDSTEIRNMYNSVIVTAKEWNEDKKEMVKEVAGIDNIIFKVYNGDYCDSYPEMIEVENIMPIIY